MLRRFYFVILILVALLLMNAGILLFQPASHTWFSKQWERFQNSGKRGFVKREFTDNQGVTHKYVIYVPFDLPSESKPPLILFMHGAGERGTDGTKPLVAGIGPAIWETKRNFPFVVLFPQEPPTSDVYSQKAFFQNVNQMLDFMIEEYHVDPDRISVTGISRGGSHSWSIVDAYPERFAAAVPISAICEPKLMKRVVKTQTPVWNVYVRGDNADSGQKYRKLFPELLELGFSPRFTELNGNLSEEWWKHDAWNFTNRSPSVFRWLLAQNRAKNQNHTKFQLVSPDTSPTQWQLPSSVWTLSEDGTLRSVGTESATEATALFRNTYRNYELHFELKIRQGTGCCLKFLKADQNDNPGFLEMKIVLPQTGSSSVIDEPGEKWLTDSDSLAEHALLPDDWNDLRIKVDHSGMKILLNGWELFSLSAEQTQELNGTLALGLPETAGSVEWRYFRIRELE